MKNQQNPLPMTVSYFNADTVEQYADGVEY